MAGLSVDNRREGSADAGASTENTAGGEAVDAKWRPKYNPWAIGITVTLATFMEVLDTSIANVSLSHIAGDLSVGQDESTWVLTSYLVSNAVVLPLSGWMSNKFGRKRFYMTCVALFTITSVLCGLAPSLAWLVFFRVLQGLGGGGLAPTEQAIIVDTFPPEKRGMAYAMYGMAVILAPAIGPTLGGYITDYCSWRWVFLINVPVGIVSLLLSNRVVEDPPHVVRARGRAGPIDVTGLALIAIGLASLEVVLDKGQSENWFESSFILGFSISAAISLIAAAFWEWHHKFPVVDIRLYRNRSFAFCNILMLILGVVHFASLVIMPQFLQTIMRYSATDAGRVLSPGGITVVLLMPLVGTLVSRVDSRLLAAFGFGMMSLSLAVMAQVLSTRIEFQMAVYVRMILGVGIAFLFVPINTIAFARLEPRMRNSASGILNLSRNIGGDIGIALVTTLVTRRAQFHQSRLGEHLSAYDTVFRTGMERMREGIARAGASAVASQREAIALFERLVHREAVVLAYIDGVWILAVFATAMIPLVFLTDRTSGATASGEH